ncbi:hypothetical protein CNYM01_10717 [Colletotrichum nymphaeae SA-01]|uniref:DUF6594 domain-containing protein n=1 Tax=Colletotrichum nymphaeae SA-01 TaxID=1460502 RepID=A0A135U8B6_9PEZI|nr:hypothetical protein CNYM01_10717 [Colletotrichum nymphaeae SA-01]
MASPNSTNNIELGEIPRQLGYGVVADAMSASQDLMIFRRFGCLNSRNLLYMQTELAYLESKIIILDQSLSDISKGLTSWQVPRSWDDLVRSEDGSEGSEQLQVVKEIRHKLEKYNSALQLQISIQALKRPKRRAWKVLNSYVEDDISNMMPGDKAFLREEFFDDLVALGEAPSDPMTNFIMKFFARLFQSQVMASSKEDRSRTRGKLNFTSDDRIRNFVRILAVIVSSVLPILSIVALYFIKSQIARLCTIVGFSALCSFALSVLTDARNAEIIATTAAYAAVQVVFVSRDVSS